MVHKTTNHKNAGFTLPELMVTILFASLIFIAFISLYFGINRTTRNKNEVTEARTQIVTGFNLITPTLGGASTILGQKTINGTNYVTSASTVAFDIPSIDASGDVIAATYDSAAIYVNGNNLLFTIEPDPSSARTSAINRVLVGDISSHQFEYENPTDIPESKWIRITVSKIAQLAGGDKPISHSALFLLKNK